MFDSPVQHVVFWSVLVLNYLLVSAVLYMSIGRGIAADGKHDRRIIMIASLFWPLILIMRTVRWPFVTAMRVIHWFKGK